MIDPPAPPSRPGMRILAARLLMAVGGIVALLSGLCSTVFLGRILIELMSGHGLSDLAVYALIVLLVGGAPLAIGLGLFVAGRSIGRKAGRRHAD